MKEEEISVRRCNLRGKAEKRGLLNKKDLSWVGESNGKRERMDILVNNERNRK